MKEASIQRSGPHSNRWGRITMERGGGLPNSPYASHYLNAIFISRSNQKTKVGRWGLPTMFREIDMASSKWHNYWIVDTMGSV